MESRSFLLLMIFLCFFWGNNPICGLVFTSEIKHIYDWNVVHHWLKCLGINRSTEPRPLPSTPLKQSPSVRGNVVDPDLLMISKRLCVLNIYEGIQNIIALPDDFPEPRSRDHGRQGLVYLRESISCLLRIWRRKDLVPPDYPCLSTRGVK